MHESIQAIATSDNYLNEKTIKSKKWSVGELCLALEMEKTQEVWLRGRIIEVDPAELTYSVFLIDQGFGISANDELLRPLPPQFSKLPDAAIKMHMADTIPPKDSDEWPYESCKIFAQAALCFSSWYVSIVGEATEDDGLPVVIWGVTQERFGRIRQDKFHNILDYLITIGYARNRSTELKCPLLEEKFDEINQKFNSTKSHDVECRKSYDADLKAQSWIPARIATKGVFNGTGTNVDDNGIIYIRNDEQKEALEKLEETLTEFYSKQPLENDPFDVTVGQSCVVMNQLGTGKRKTQFISTLINISLFLGFCRAVIEKLPKDGLNFEVNLIDYGTFETVERQEIFSNLIETDFPTLINKFRLSSIVPLNNKKNIWSKAALNLTYSLTVDSKLKVEVKEYTDDVAECSIESERLYGCKDVQKLLVKNQMARWRLYDDDWPPAKKCDVSSTTDDSMTLLQLAMDLMKCFVVPRTLLASTQETIKFFKNCEEFIYIRHLEKVDKKKPPFPIIHVPYFDLEAASITEFDCIFVNYCSVVYNDCVKIYVIPDIPELNEIYCEVEKLLAETDQSKLEKLSELECRYQNTNCLVSTESGLKRARIENIIDENNFKMFLLDSAKIVSCNRDQLFSMPPTVTEYPKKTLLLLLKGITDNAHHDDYDNILKKLKQMLIGKKLKAVLSDYSRVYPIANLFDDGGSLVYQSLIDGIVV